MSSAAPVIIHASQFPENLRRDLLASLRTRRINHKFHYDSLKQTQKWLALHEAYSPARTDPDCAATYDRSFAAAVERIATRNVHLVGLGCGGGQKDTRLLRLLSASGKQVAYTPSDVSVAMVLTARKAALQVFPEMNCVPLVCDLATAGDLPHLLDEMAAPLFKGRPRRKSTPNYARLITFFGMIPNFEPRIILPRLAKLVRSADFLLFSANLAPGPDYAAGLKRILPLYDNQLTRDWLSAFLLDLGLKQHDGKLRFVIEPGPASGGLKRIAAYFDFVRPRKLELEANRFIFRTGDTIRLFFSYRHTLALVRKLLNQHRLQVLAHWITRSEEEGVFLVARC